MKPIFHKIHSKARGWLWACSWITDDGKARLIEGLGPTPTDAFNDWDVRMNKYYHPEWH